MTAVLEPLSWAYPQDIPGNRLPPEDTQWPRPYHLLDDKNIWRELRLLAKPQSKMFESGIHVDSVNFQPAPGSRTQDRYVVKQIDVHGRSWTFTGVFDGHLGEATVEHVAHHLPIIVYEFLTAACSPTYIPNHAKISSLLSESIVAFDNAIARDVLDIFGGIDGLEEFSDAAISSIINDQYLGGTRYKRALLCMYGTTALVALTDPDRQHLWVANLGDCQAYMVTQGHCDWAVERLTVEHNGSNDAELERVRHEHPNEPECIVDRRVLGALAPTRCIGDIPFKQPPEFSRRILYNIMPGFQDTSPWEAFLQRNRTPPYVTAQPDVIHRELAPQGSTAYLIMASDGFSDLCSDEIYMDAGTERVILDWARDMSVHPGLIEGQPKTDNMALRLLHRAIGGDDRRRVSQILTLESNAGEQWIDDTSIVVRTL
ncbi:protein serine/threonine phosphatase 2C [Fistulina hepatica ATCC 64428]|uniref:Protein serine/threonine phosphatase 2C n=1 Tax=Fistulina hepatica ATCC 64428 TaxID=1128425 RepID=A0A0D7AE91_9AGAR|nr:protein serine/threonine phosphatase 2C [Fistulina hepatica ATCC 64428]